MNEIELIDRKVKELRESEPGFCTGKKWYDRQYIVDELTRMNYSETIAQELADWHLLHIQHAFDRGFFTGVKKTMQSVFLNSQLS